MGLRTCRVLGCHKTTGLHHFPSDPELLGQWLRACGLDEKKKLPPRAGVCDEHFTPDDYNNLTEVKMGFGKQLRLHRKAIPTLSLPRARSQPLSLLLPRLDGLPEDTKPLLLPLLEGLPAQIDSKPPHLPSLEGKGAVDVFCQTDKVLTKHAFIQVDRKPSYRSKAIQARTPFRSVECSTVTLTNPEANLVKRKRCDGSDGDSSSSCAGGTDNNCTSKEVPPQKSQFIVEEDKLMELFVWCPICSNRCDVFKTMTQTLLCVKQRCTHCHFTNEWFSHS